MDSAQHLRQQNAECGSSAIDILLVEDDLTLAELMQGALEIRGYHPIHASNRQEALTILQHSREIKVALIDLGLPPHEHDMREGLALLAAIRQSGRNIKIVVLTGQDQQAAAMAVIRDGAFDFLPKPAAMPTILAALERAQLFERTEAVLEQQGISRIDFNAVVGEGLKQVRDEAEERLVRRVLHETGFNVHESARRLGIKRENIYYFLKKFGITRPHDPDDEAPT